VSAIVLILKTKGHALINYYMHLNLIMHLVIVMSLGMHLLIVMDLVLRVGIPYFVLNFYISTMFDIIPFELVRFRNLDIP
jgi:hypothetical protein